MGSAHPTWLERATPEEIKEITEIDRSIADLRRRRSSHQNAYSGVDRSPPPPYR